jgi:hypothetical protein
MPLDIEALRKKAASGLQLNAEAEAAVRADDARRAEEQREQARAKRVTEALDLEPELRSAAEGAQAELRSLVTQIVNAIGTAREAREKHEAVARIIRSGGERCPAVPSLKVTSINDRTLYRDLDQLRFSVQSDW